MFRAIVSLVLALFASTVVASGNSDPATEDRVSASPVLYLNGVITGRSISPLFQYLDNQTKKETPTPTIRMVINSPGGSVIAGMLFINRMTSLQARGVHFDCYVLDVAASMAFQILTQCDSRTSLPTSFLLWHGVRTGASDLTAKGAIALAQDLKRMDELVLMQLDNSLDLMASTIRYHFDRETLWSGLSLHVADPKFIRLDTFSDVLTRLDSAVKSAPSSFFDQMQQLTESEIIYVWSDYPGIAGGVEVTQ